MRRLLSAVASTTSVDVLTARPASRERARPRGRRRLSGAEWALLAAFAVVSVWVLGLDLWQVIVNGRVWTGTDGSYVTDQMQYLAWIESASRHLLAENLFVLHGTPADYFQPAIAVSGLLTRVGLAPTVALLVWKPVAVVSMFLAARAYVRRALPIDTAGPRLAAIALALFYGSFTVVYGRFGVLGDLFPGFLSWGYPFALMAIAALVFGLLSYGSARQAGRFSLTPGLLGALASSLHPWQGETLVLVVVGCEVSLLWRAFGERRSLRDVLVSPPVRLALATAVVAALPLVYYLALGKLDLSWSLGRNASKHELSVLSIALALAPLAAVALLGVRRPGAGFVARSARVWPLAAIVIFLQSGSTAGATPLHAFGGITVPLAVLAVEGCMRLGWRRIPHVRALTVGLILLATLPTTAYELALARSNAKPTSGNANFITHDERLALDYLRRDPTPGGVLTRFYLGSAVPGRTGRHTFVGDCIWSQPNCEGRGAIARDLLYGSLAPAEARQFVASSGARFILSDCNADRDLTQDLRPLIASVRHFGCATVYELR